jgi:hypothetical protein
MGAAEFAAPSFLDSHHKKQFFGTEDLCGPAGLALILARIRFNAADLRTASDTETAVVISFNRRQYVIDT